ncbi:MAG: hypothetical protein ABI347_00795 [Nitrososphaera sp.]
MRNPAKMRSDTLAFVLETASRQLSESAQSVEDLKSLLPMAKSAQERTTMNIVIDDQKKVLKTLERLTNDLQELIAS